MNLSQPGMQLRRVNRFAQRHGTAIAMILLLLVMGAGELASAMSWVDPRYFPRPIDAVRELLASFFHAYGLPGEENTALSLGEHTLKTLGRWGAGFGAASFLGVSFGIMLGQSRAARAVMTPLISLLRALPSAALLPVCLAVIGQKWLSQFLIILFGTVWPILLNSTAAVLELPKEASDALSFMQLGFARRQAVILRSAAVGVMTGLELGCSVAFLLAVTTEIFIPSRGGIGWYIYNHSQGVPEPAQIFAALLLLASLGLFLNTAVQQAGRAIADGAFTYAAVRRQFVRVAFSFLPRRLNSRFLVRQLPRRVKDSKYMALLEADYVTEQIKALFGTKGIGWTLKVESPLKTPYVYPEEMRDREGYQQRDIRFIVPKNEETILFARAWIRASDFPSHVAHTVRKDLETGQKTVGEIVHEYVPDLLAFENLSYKEVVSEKLGRVFAPPWAQGPADAVDLVHRSRVIRIAGRPAIFIHEFVPVADARPTATVDS